MESAGPKQSTQMSGLYGISGGQGLPLLMPSCGQVFFFGGGGLWWLSLFGTGD